MLVNISVAANDPPSLVIKAELIGELWNPAGEEPGDEGGLPRRRHSGNDHQMTDFSLTLYGDNSSPLIIFNENSQNRRSETGLLFRAWLAMRCFMR